MCGENGDACCDKLKVDFDMKIELGLISKRLHVLCL